MSTLETVGMDRSGRFPPLPVALVVLVALAAYATSLGNGYAYDDVWIIQNNARVHELSNLREIWLTSYWPEFGDELGAYRPLTIFLFAVQWALAGGKPWIFHAINVALHAVVCVFVLFLLRRFVGLAAAAFGAVVFAVHPVHVEAVANGVGQAELTAAALVLGACLIHLARPRTIATSHRAIVGRLLRSAAVALLYVLAVLAKESAITLPGLLLILDVADGRVGRTPADWLRYGRSVLATFGLMATAVIGYFALRASVLGSITAIDPTSEYPFLKGEHRVLNAWRAWPEYVRLLFFPRELSSDYSPAVILPVESWTPMVLLGFALFAATVVLAAMLPVQRVSGLPAAWFLVSILTVSNLLFPVGILVAERTLYLPSVAVAFIAAFCWQTASRQLSAARARTALAFAVAVVVLLGARTVIRAPEWKDTPTILRAQMRDRPESYRSQWRIAKLALHHGDTAVSIDHWEFAYRLWPHSPTFRVEFATMNYVLGNYERVVELLQTLVDERPSYELARILLVQSYAHMGRYEEALALAERSLATNGPSVFDFEWRGRSLMALGRHQEAVASLRAAIRQEEGDGWVPWLLLARALHDAGGSALSWAAFDTARVRAHGDSSALAVIEDVVRGVREDASFNIMDAPIMRIELRPGPK